MAGPTPASSLKADGLIILSTGSSQKATATNDSSLSRLPMRGAPGNALQIAFQQPPTHLRRVLLERLHLGLPPSIFQTADAINGRAGASRTAVVGVAMGAGGGTPVGLSPVSASAQQWVEERLQKRARTAGFSTISMQCTVIKEEPRQARFGVAALVEAAKEAVGARQSALVLSAGGGAGALHMAADEGTGGLEVCAAVCSRSPATPQHVPGTASGLARAAVKLEAQLLLQQPWRQWQQLQCHQHDEHLSQLLWQQGFEEAKRDLEAPAVRLLERAASSPNALGQKQQEQQLSAPRTSLLIKRELSLPEPASQPVLRQPSQASQPLSLTDPSPFLHWKRQQQEQKQEQQLMQRQYRESTLLRQQRQEALEWNMQQQEHTHQVQQQVKLEQQQLQLLQQQEHGTQTQQQLFQQQRQASQLHELQRQQHMQQQQQQQQLQRDMQQQQQLQHQQLLPPPQQLQEAALCEGTWPGDTRRSAASTLSPPQMQPSPSPALMATPVTTPMDPRGSRSAAPPAICHSAAASASAGAKGPDQLLDWYAMTAWTGANVSPLL